MMIMEVIISVILLFLGIVILIIIHICVVARAFRGDQRPNFIPGRAENWPQPLAMDPEAVKKLPWFDHSGDHSNIVVECAVCLDSFGEGDKCRVLPVCGHCFHVECIDSWLMKTGACPVCRSSCLLVRTGHNNENNEGQRSVAELVQ